MDIPDSGAVFTFGNSKFGGHNADCFWLKNDTIISASCGDEHTAIVTKCGKLYVFGSNDWGQLGLGHTHQVSKPTCVKHLKASKVCNVACGRNHTIVSAADGRIFVCGNNSDSQLGLEDVDSTDVPLELNIENCENVKQIEAGADFSAVLTAGGLIYVWGSNSEGQLGLGTEVNQMNKPAPIRSIDQVRSIACGYYHMAAVTESGDLYTFGEDEYGKLGERHSSDNYVPSKVKMSTSVKALSVACGGSHTAFICVSGNLYTMGNGNHGELGHGENVLQVTKPMLIDRLQGHDIFNVSCGENFTCAVTKKGRLYTFGDGRNGKLAANDENFTNQFRPFRCGRFDRLRVSFAKCGGCHMVVHAHNDINIQNIINMDSDDEDPMQTKIGNPNFTIPKKPIDNDLEVDDTVSLYHSVSAREKRRQNRGSMLSQTLPPLKTLKPMELEEAARTLPKPTQERNTYSFNGLWSHKTPATEQLDTDAVSDVSTFNKVHVLHHSEDFNMLLPVNAMSSTEKIAGQPIDTSAEENKTSALNVKVSQIGSSNAEVPNGEKEADDKNQLSGDDMENFVGKNVTDKNLTNANIELKKDKSHQNIPSEKSPIKDQKQEEEVEGTRCETEEDHSEISENNIGDKTDVDPGTTDQTVEKDSSNDSSNIAKKLEKQDSSGNVMLEDDNGKAAAPVEAGLSQQDGVKNDKNTTATKKQKSRLCSIL